MKPARKVDGDWTAGLSYSRLTTTLRIVFCALIALLVLPLGSVDPKPLHLFSFCFFLLAAIVVVTRPVPSNLRVVFVAGVTIACGLAAWIGFQAMDIPGNPLANPIWAQAEEFFGPMPRAISVAPGDSIETLLQFMLPFIVFLSGLLLFSSDESARRLLRFLCIFGSAVAVFGLIEFIFFPTQLLLSKKETYFDSLTASFVNRNTAATFLGVTLLLNVALAFSHLQNAGVRDLLGMILGRKGRTEQTDLRWAIIHSVGGGLTFVALMLTRSRGGIGSSFLGLLIVLAILGYFGMYSSRRQGGFTRTSEPMWLRLGRVFGLLLGSFLIGSVFAGQALLRAEVQGGDDGRFCIMPGLLRLLSDNWLTGTGLGTFRDVFTPYKNPECGIRGVWVNAHNAYIEGWVTLGLPFMVVTVVSTVVLIAIFVRGIQTRRRLRWVPAAGLGLMVIVLAHSALDFSMQIPGLSVFWAATITACVVVASERSASRTHSPHSRRNETAQISSDSNTPINI